MDGHILDYDELVASGGYLDSTSPALSSGAASTEQPDRRATGGVRKEHVERPVFVRERLMRALDNLDVDGNPLGEAYDVLLYPAITGLAGNLGCNPSAGSNNRLARSRCSRRW